MINYKLLQDLRKQKKWSYKTLSKKINIPIDIIKLWETGEMLPTKEDIISLAHIYEVSIDELYYEEEKVRHISIIKIILIFILSILLGIIFKSYIYIILFPILNILLYIILYNLSPYKEGDGDYPRSLFGLNIHNDDKKIYFMESNLISIIYTYITLLFRLLNIDFLIPKINIIREKNVNTLLIIVIAYLLLMILSFIIELVFGKFIKKEYKE